MRLWLARHALPVPDAAGCCYGRLDVAADPAATAQAARRLHGQLPTRVRVRCSPASRCRALADALAAHRPGLQVHESEALREMDFGDWEGQRWDAIGEAALRGWTSDFAAHRPGGGETVTELMARVQAALQAECGAARDVLWITHAGVIRAARLLLAGTCQVHDAGQWPSEPVPFGGLEAHPLPVSGAAAEARA